IGRPTCTELIKIDPGNNSIEPTAVEPRYFRGRAEIGRRNRCQGLTGVAPGERAILRACAFKIFNDNASGTIGGEGNGCRVSASTAPSFMNQLIVNPDPGAIIVNETQGVRPLDR